MKGYQVITLAIMSLMVSTLQVQTVQSIPSNQRDATAPKPLVAPKSQQPPASVQTLKFDKTIVADAGSGYGGSGQPRGTSGGDEQCLPKDPPLTALSPMTRQKTTLVVTTSKTTPTLWFYMPNYSAGTTIELMLKEYQSSAPPYRQTYSLLGKAGIISITLPAAKKLTPEKPYIWQLRVVCNRRDGSAAPLVSGEVKLLRSASALKLPQDSIQRILIYANAGLWEDTLTNITKLAPAQRQKYLRELLQAYGLENFSDQPIVPIKK